MAEQEKIIDKIKKLMSLAESEEALGNTGAAENIGAKAQELLMKYKLSHADITLVETFEPDYIPPIMGKSIVINPFLRVNAVRKSRSFWFEKLAAVVAEGYFCKSRIEGNEVWFYGLDMDREIAIYMFGKIAEKAKAIHDLEMEKLRKVVGIKAISFGRKSIDPDLPKFWVSDQAFTDSFHLGFRLAIKNGFEANVNADDPIRQKAMKDVEDFISTAPTERFDSFYQRETWDYSDIKRVQQDTWDFVINLGRKYGERVFKKSSSPIQTSSNGDNALTVTEKKGFIGEVYAVLDDSGSMNGYRIAELKEGTKNFASEAIAKGFAVGLIKFGSEPSHLITPQTQVNRAFLGTLNKLDASSGNTMMAAALKEAQIYFRNSRLKRTVLLVTDGYPSDGEENVIQAAMELKRNGIEIMTIGCGSANEDFLKRLASKASMGELVADTDLGKGMRRMAGLLGA